MTSEWLTGIGLSIGLTGAAATAAGAAIVGGGLGLITSDIMNLVEGNYPWSDPEQFFVSGLKGAGIGAAGGAVTSAIGPVLGAAAEKVGLASNLGTQAANSGVPTGGISLSGQAPKVGVDIVTGAGGTNASGGVLQEALGKAAVNAGMGAAQDPDNPLRGAAMGGVSSLASAGVSGLARNIAPRFAGQSAMNSTGMGRASMIPSGGEQFDFRPVQSSNYSLMGRSAPTYSPPSFGARAFGAGSRVASGLAGRAASQMTGSALTPPPPDPMAQNPWAAYNRPMPYWTQRG